MIERIQTLGFDRFLCLGAKPQAQGIVGDRIALVRESLLKSSGYLAVQNVCLLSLSLSLSMKH